MPGRAILIYAGRSREASPSHRHLRCDDGLPTLRTQHFPTGQVVWMLPRGWLHGRQWYIGTI